jgi:hypothetical protein
VEDEDDDAPWLNVLPASARHFRQLQNTCPMPPHCLQGYIPEEPSTQWLEPEGDAVVQHFSGARSVALKSLLSCTEQALQMAPCHSNVGARGVGASKEEMEEMKAACRSRKQA